MNADDTLARSLREGLAARDRALPAPSFARLHDGEQRGVRAVHWRPAVVAAASAAFVAIGLLWWTVSREPGPGQERTAATMWKGSAEKAGVAVLDAGLAQALSYSSYWHVPTDELLAFAPAPMGFELGIDTGPQVSLEESLL